MKRPLPIYFVAFWCFFAMVIQVNGFVKMGELRFHDPTDREFVSGAGGLIDILVIWHTVRLIQLKKFNIWLSIGFFVVLTVALYVKAFIILVRVPSAVRLLMPLMFYASLNVICFVYLVRPTFRAFAARFFAEREAPKRYQEAQENLSEGGVEGTKEIKIRRRESSARIIFAN